MDSYRNQGRAETAILSQRLLLRGVLSAPTRGRTLTSLRCMSRRKFQMSSRAALQSHFRRSWQPCCKRLRRTSDCTAAKALTCYVQAALTLAHWPSTKLPGFSSETRHTVFVNWLSPETLHRQFLCQRLETPSSKSLTLCGQVGLQFCSVQPSSFLFGKSYFVLTSLQKMKAPHRHLCRQQGI